MATRDELKTLIDHLPDSSLETVRVMLGHQIHPPAPRPETERMEQRSSQYREQVLKRFRETAKPGTIGGGGGTGFLSEYKGIPFGRESFHYWDDKSLVHQALQHFDRQEIEIMERLSFSSDRTTLICAWEISSGGYTAHHEDVFPIPPGREPLTS